MEMTTKLGGATGSGAAVALGLGHSATMRTRHSTGGTLKDYAAPVNMTFLGSYFSQVANRQTWLSHLYRTSGYLIMSVGFKIHFSTLFFCNVRK